MLLLDYNRYYRPENGTKPASVLLSLREQSEQVGATYRDRVLQPQGESAGLPVALLVPGRGLQG